MQAIVQDKLRLRQRYSTSRISRRPAIGDPRCVGSGSCGRRQPGRLGADERLPLHRAARALCTASSSHTTRSGGTDFAGRSNGRDRVTRFKPGRRGLRRQPRFIRRVAACAKGGLSISHKDLTSTKPPRSRSPGLIAFQAIRERRSGRAAGPGQRRLGWRRHVRRPVREGADAEVPRGQHPERRPAEVDRRGSRRRLHEGRLHPGQPSGTTSSSTTSRTDR